MVAIDPLDAGKEWSARKVGQMKIRFLPDGPDSMAAVRPKPVARLLS